MASSGVILSEPARGRLRKERLGRKLTLRQVADKLGLTHAMISHIETGRKNPSAQVLAALCELYRLRLEPARLVRAR